jgi:hypothetical protein
MRKESFIMNTRRFFLRLLSLPALLLSGVLLTTTTIAATDENQNDSFRGRDRDEQTCLPGIESAVRRNPIYQQLYVILASNQNQLRNLLAEVDDQASYEALLARARAVASKVEAGRVVLTLPDGTVVVDTAAVDDPGNVLESGNSYMHFVEKTVNENHNSRVAIFATQLYPCGIGLERKLSTTTGETESYLALRLGRHLDSVGSARLSTRQAD